MIALPVATVGSLRLRKGWKGTEGDPPALISQLALGVGVFESVVSVFVCNGIIRARVRRRSATRALPWREAS